MEGIKVTQENAASHPEISLVKIGGYIDTTTSSELERVLQSLLREQRFKIIMDLSSVEYISSAGWGIFISEIKNIRLHGGDLKLAGMSESVNEVYELLEFSTILTAAPTLDDAIRMFTEGPAPTSGAKPGAVPTSARPMSAPVAKPPVAAPRPMSASPAPAFQSVPPAAKPAPVQPVAPKSQPLPPLRPAAVPPIGSLGNNQPSAPAAAPQAPAAAPLTKPASGPIPLIERIRGVVRAYPQWGAWAIKKELNRTRGSEPKVGWGEVRVELKYNNLNTREARFKYSRPKGV